MWVAEGLAVMRVRVSEHGSAIVVGAGAGGGGVREHGSAIVGGGAGGGGYVDKWVCQGSKSGLYVSKLGF